MPGQSCPSSCPRRARTGNAIVPCFPSPGGSPHLHTPLSRACWEGEPLSASSGKVQEEARARSCVAGLGRSGWVPPFAAVLPCVCWHIALLPPRPPCHCPCSNCMGRHWLLVAAVWGVAQTRQVGLAPKSNIWIAEVACGKKEQKVEPKSGSLGESGVLCAAGIPGAGCRTQTSCRTAAQRVLTSQERQRPMPRFSVQVRGPVHGAGAEAGGAGHRQLRRLRHHHGGSLPEVGRREVGPGGLSPGDDQSPCVRR